MLRCLQAVQFLGQIQLAFTVFGEKSGRCLQAVQLEGQDTVRFYSFWEKMGQIFAVSSVGGARYSVILQFLAKNGAGGSNRFSFATTYSFFVTVGR